MWTRAKLKEKAKEALNKNYWKVILVSLIVVLVGGGSIIGTSTTVGEEFGTAFESAFEEAFEEGGEDDFWDEDSYDNGVYYDDGYEDGYDDDLYWEGYEEDIWIFAIVMLLFSALISTVMGMIYDVIIENPIAVGVNRFFVKSLNEAAEVKEVAYAFDHNYKNVIKILFIRDIKLLGWTLLFIVPGIVKGLEYRMIPYLLAENPDMTTEEAFRLSKQMMTGNKWDTFVLEWSFIGWDILSALTAGILGVFYVNGYKHLTYAALYEALSELHGHPVRTTAQPYMEASYVQAIPQDETEATDIYNLPEY